MCIDQPNTLVANELMRYLVKILNHKWQENYKTRAYIAVIQKLCNIFSKRVARVSE